MGRDFPVDFTSVLQLGSMITPTEVGKITPKNLMAGRQQPAIPHNFSNFQTSKENIIFFSSGRLSPSFWSNHNSSPQISRKIVTVPISLPIFCRVRSDRANLTIGSPVYQPQYLRGFDDHPNKKSTAGFMLFEGKHPTEDISCLQMKKWSKHLKAKHKSPQCWVFFFKTHSLLGASSHLVSG